MAENNESKIIHRSLDAETDSPAVAIAESVAEIEGKEADELTTTYDCIDATLDELFSTPPSQDAQLEITFTYEGYRITVEQNGSAKFVRVT
jgi:hypothetical protein